MWDPAQTPEPSVRLLPSFLGPDGPVETNDLITGVGQVAQGVVRILGKDDLGREEMGSHCCGSDPSPQAGLREAGTRGCTPLQQCPDVRSIQAALTHHGHQGQCLLLQLALDSPGNVLDVRQGKVLKQLRAQVPCMGLKQLERLPGT